MLMTIIILMCFGTLTAPPFITIYVEEADKIKVYDPMLYAFEKVESNFDTDTINRLGYGGILQIGQEMIDEVNRICKIRSINAKFALSDRLDSTKSVQVWYIVQTYWNPSYTLKNACRVWNPLASKKYYNKIKKLI